MGPAERDRPTDEPAPSPERPPLFSRRAWLLLGANVLVGGGYAAKLLWDRHERGQRAEVFVGRVPSYTGPIADTLLRGLASLGVGAQAVRGRTVLLKPNLVEPNRSAPHINTHPLVVQAAAEVFRRLGAREVWVAEGPGHMRDTELVLEESGLGPLLEAERLPFYDLNHEDTAPVPNALGLTGLSQLHLPRVLARADLVVSLAKMKTHHWAGLTLSMKNLFGVVPGVAYGWPKNVLHQRGIGSSILDLTATVRPHLAIVDGIVGMEGDGPIMGTPKAAGLLVVGRNPVAVDATCARLMGFEPRRVPYLAAAAGKLGPVREGNIAQRGESIAPLVTPFTIVDHPSLRHLRG